MSGSVVVASDVHETVTQVLRWYFKKTQRLLNGLEQAEITVKALQEQVELPLCVYIYIHLCRNKNENGNRYVSCT